MIGEEQGLTKTGVAAGICGALAILLIAGGCAMALAQYDEEWARTGGVVMALAGIVLLFIAALLAMKRIAERVAARTAARQTSDLVQVMTAIDEVENLRR